MTVWEVYTRIRHSQGGGGGEGISDHSRLLVGMHIEDPPKGVNL